MKIVLQHLTKKFPARGSVRGRKNREDVIAVNDFDFEIPDGKLIGLLGPSGCGKSTALNLICGLLKPTEGKIFFGEDDVTGLPPENRGVGMVFQNYALYPHLTVEKNIQFPLENLKGADKLSKEEMSKRVLEAAKLVQIDHLLERKPNELSGGQQQRVAIARALVKLPRVLLLDEPLSNLDARLRLQTREEIRRIQQETQITTIFVTHDQDEAMSISDMIVVMKDGIVQQIGNPQSVDQPGQRGMSCSLDAVHHILIRLFSESFHSGNDLLVTVQPEQIRIFMDKALIDQLLQCCLGESVNIQRISADEQSVGFDLLGRAFLIGTVQRLYLIHLSDLRGLSAHRTHLWNLHIITACQILSDLGNDHVGLIDRDMVSDSQSEGSHDTDIMHGSAAHRCAFQFHRLKNSYRIDQTGTAGAPLDFF